jgi:surface polysaccharide O-acyltransferase-like enzyme
MSQQRIVFLDFLRVIACTMVIFVHTCEFFYIDGDGIGISSADDALWVCIIDSAFRCAVPLFVLISAYLLVPIKVDMLTFFRRRLVRVVIPFIIWSVLYAVLPILWGEITVDDACGNLAGLVTNFIGSNGHMWFIYMLIGLYLFMPVISPWLEKVDKRAELAFIALWFVSTFFPYLRTLVGNGVYGECFWNEYHLLWYFSGFIGYVVLAHYIRCQLNWSPRLMVLGGTAIYLVGYVETATVWHHLIPTASSLVELEISWRFCTPNVAMMGFGLFIVVKGLMDGVKTETWIVKDVSKLSYGMYLMHIFVLNAMYQTFVGYFSTPVTILVVGVSTFILSYAITKLLSLIPCGKYIVG